MKKSHVHLAQELKMDLTPLIDCVFLLILFFLLTTEITVQIEDVDLSFALEGREEEPDPRDSPLIINVVRDKEDKKDQRAGKIIYSGEDVDLKKLTKLLKKEAQVDALPRSQGGRGHGWEIGPGGTKLSKVNIIVRSDRGVASRYVRTIFTACAQAHIYKVKVSTVKPE